MAFQTPERLAACLVSPQPLLQLRSGCCRSSQQALKLEGQWRNWWGLSGDVFNLNRTASCMSRAAPAEASRLVLQRAAAIQWLYGC